MAWWLIATMLALEAAAAVDLHRQRSSPFDLAVTGRLTGVAAGETRFVRWADLRALPTVTVKLTGEFVPGEQQVTIAYLSDLWAALPLAADADTVLATCADGYASVFRAATFADIRPFLILEIDGQGPEKWPPPGLNFNPAPYVISVATAVAPAVARLLDANHKRPWAVTTLEIARYEARFAGFFSGRWGALSPRATAGREIWINSCASCHSGPPGTFGGTKSDRHFDVLATHAARNPDYFRVYVRDPQGFVAIAKMDAHPHYTDVQLDALIAFVTADGKK